jgi:HK97 family phage major capsid protein
MATATATELAKLSAKDLVAKLEDEIKPRLAELKALESRDAAQDADLIDCLDEAEMVQSAIRARSEQEIQARLDKVSKFDAPKPRKAGGSGAPGTFACLGERLQAVSKFAHGHIDPRLFRNALGANEATPSDGGFMVGSDDENDLMSKVYGSPILSRVPRTPISSASNALNLRLLKETSRADGSRQGGVQAYWQSESESITASTRQYEKFQLMLEDLYALSYATNQLLEDAPALQAEMSNGFVEEMTFKIEDAVINGDGVGKPLGIINSPAAISVAVETGQTLTNALVYENVVKMYARLHPRSQMSAIWLIDQTLIPDLMFLSIPVGTGGAPVYVPSNGAADAPFGTLLGRPVIFTEYTQKRGTVGDIILWDPNSYRLIEKGGFNAAESMHVAFLTNEMAFRWTARVNGAPKWSAALTPKNTGSTLSTIVTLAVRT